MKVKRKNGNEIWIHYPDQCKLCNGSESCSKEKTMEFISAIRKLENEHKGVYGTLEFRCDYFSLDDEKLSKNNLYENESSINC